MQSYNRLLKIAILLGIPSLLGACGGGGGGGSTPTASQPPSTGGTAPPAPTITTTRGQISGFGSVFIDGERFETDDDTDFRKGDDASSQDDFRVGMIVKIKSRSRNSSGERIAEKVEFDEDIKGPVDSVNASGLVVMGQTVIVDEKTRFDSGLSLATIQQDDILEISGFRIANDELQAVFIEDKAFLDVDKYELVGQVRDLDTDLQQFRVGQLMVDYSQVLPDDLDALSEDMLVEVKDENKTYMGGDLVLVASKVEGENRFDFDDDDGSDADDDHEYEVEGVISEILSDTSFMMGDILVNHSATTEFRFGDAGDISVGTRVEVEGDVSDSADNTIQADKIKFKKNAARIAGLADVEVDEDSGEVTVSVMGVVLEVSDLTEMKDARDDVEPLTLDDLMDSDFLEVRGSSFENILRAVELERDDSDDDSELRGTVQTFDDVAQTLMIMGVQVNTDPNTQYRDSDDGSDTQVVLTAEQFFDRLHENQTQVQAKWNGAVADTVSPARQLELED